MFGICISLAILKLSQNTSYYACMGKVSASLFTGECRDTQEQKKHTHLFAFIRRYYYNIVIVCDMG